MEKIISNNFIRDLQEGVLKNILKYVKSDTTLAMEIRKDCINIYYRGGSLLKIKEENNLYNGYFDKNYIKSENSQSVIVECISNINSISKANKLIECIPKIKQQMDLWMKVEKPNGGEREYKHLIAKENNYGNIGRNTDYFIGDIEYRGNNNKNYLFDMIGVKWDVEDSATKSLDLSLFQMYYPDKSLGLSQNYIEDLKNINDFLEDKELLKSLKSELKEIYKVKSALGLLYPYDEIDIDFSDKIEIIYIFVNPNTKDDKLKNILTDIVNSKEYASLSKISDIKISKSSFMGYGLYSDNMVNLEDVINLI